MELQDLVPVLLGQVGGAVHGAAVADDEAVPGLGPRQAEVCVLQLQHRLQEVGLEVESLGLRQQTEADLWKYTSITSTSQDL